MVEKKNSEKTLQEILSDALAQDLIDDPPTPMSFEEFEDMLDRHEADKKRKRRRKMTLIAAMFLVVIVGAALVFSTFTTDVGANKNAPEEIVTEDGVVIEDGGYGSSSEDDWVITNWDEVTDAKAVIPKFIFPEYIPAGYEFDKLTIEQVETGSVTYEYFFSSIEKEILEIEFVIQEEHLTSMDISNVSRKIETSKGNVYIQESGIKIATIQIDGGIMIHIIGNINDNELIQIIESISI